MVSAYDEDRDHLELRLPDGVVVSGRPEADGEALLVDFYGRRVSARVVDGDFTEALSRYAGHEVRLARPDRPGDALDVRPVTLVSLESVAELAEHGGHDGTLDPGRFRMTIEIEGVSRPHEEDSRGVRSGSARCSCGRDAGPPVRRHHARLRRPANATPTLRVIRDYRGLNAERELEFGVHARSSAGRGSRGDPVEPIE